MIPFTVRLPITKMLLNAGAEVEVISNFCRFKNINCASSRNKDLKFNRMAMGPKSSSRTKISTMLTGVRDEIPLLAIK